MISKAQSSTILNYLVGLTDPSAMSNVYLGLCASEPNRTTGVVSGEPTSVNSYERKLITNNKASEYFTTSSNTGVITNKKEIQMKTAREDYPEKINWWFFSNSSSGNAYLWGKIKDVIFDAQSVGGFVADSGGYRATIASDNLLDLVAGENYIVSWDGVEYEVTATLTEEGGVSYIVLGDMTGNYPFVIGYNESTTGADTVGNIQFGSMSDVASHNVAIYGIGIDIKKATVPTFYEGQLTASIDAN